MKLDSHPTVSVHRMETSVLGMGAERLLGVDFHSLPLAGKCLSHAVCLLMHLGLGSPAPSFFQLL